MNMPILRPIPIPTKGKSFFGRIKAWLFEPRKWEVVETFEFYIFLLEKHIIIPKGFITDFASIPRMFWNILDPLGILMIPGLIHDFAYMYDALLDKDKNVILENKGRKYWDKLFLKVSYQVNGIKTPDKIAWFVLHLFGFTAWNKHRKKGKDLKNERFR